MFDKTLQKTNDKATGTSLKNGDELGCSRMVRTCSTSGTHHVTLGENLVISHE